MSRTATVSTVAPSPVFATVSVKETVSPLKTTPLWVFCSVRSGVGRPSPQLAGRVGGVSTAFRYARRPFTMLSAVLPV